MFFNECVWPGVTSPEGIEIFNFVSFFLTRRYFFRTEGCGGGGGGEKYRIEILRYIEWAL